VKFHPWKIVADSGVNKYSMILCQTMKSCIYSFDALETLYFAIADTSCVAVEKEPYVSLINMFFISHMMQDLKDG
jgi:hypothetical protein